MLFNSFQFFAFLPIVFLLYFAVPRPHRWAPALLASYYFYMCWKPAFLVLIGISTLTDFGVALQIAAARSPRTRKAWLGVSLGVNLGLLFSFKYLDFALHSLEILLQGAGWGVELPLPGLLLPVGISFYTFQTLSYTLDVYRKQVRPERHLGKYATYVAFFPQLVAGPIERSSHLLPQIVRGGCFDPARMGPGLRLILWGLFKKMCISDLLATPVSRIFGQPDLYSGGILIIGAFFFALQIYCDFSGYSDIAIGSARLLGIDLMTNFKRPYFARNFHEFWSRWHISLSTWFKDYVYIPLGGNRGTRTQWIRNILIVFLVSGIWHGAAWHFVVWGGLHGGLLLVEGRSKKSAVPRSNLRNLWAMGRTFLLTCIAWVFFRANTLREALDYLAGIVCRPGIQLAELDKLGLPSFEIALCFIFAGLFVVLEIIQERKPARIMQGWTRPELRALADGALIYAIVFFGVFDQVDFIYFQF